MNRITVSPNQFLKYKQTETVEEGEYFIFQNVRFDSIQKKIFKPIACTDKQRNFFWLIKAEKWIEKIMENKKCETFDAEINLKDFFLLPNSIRNWQVRILKSFLLEYKFKKEYRKGIIAPLGGGKTLFGLLLASLDPTEALVIAPRNIHDDWRNESRKWQLPIPQVTTYESAYKYRSKQILILDEILAVKNPKAQRTGHIQNLSKHARIVVGFTGTPMGAKQVYDLRWLNVLNPGCFPNSEKQIMFLWGEPYLEEIPTVGNVYKNDIWHMEQISLFTEDLIETVDFEEIRKELPEIEYKKIQFQPNEDDLYQIVNQYYADNKHKAIAQFKQYSDGFIYLKDGSPLNFHFQKIDWLKAFIEDNPEESIIVYANWNATLDLLKREFPNASIISGETKDIEHEKNRFKRKETNLLLANTRISQGMNLQETCRIMIFFSNSSNPIDRKQAEGRIYRPGQKNAVQIIDLLGSEMDERQLELIQKYSASSESYIDSLLEQEYEKIKRKLFKKRGKK